MKSTLKIVYLMILLFFTANISLNAQLVGCDWEAELQDVAQASGFAVGIDVYSGSYFGLDPCTNHCFVVIIDAGTNDSKKFNVSCQTNDYENLAYPYGNGIYQATICIGADAGTPVSLPTSRPIAIQIDDVTSSGKPFIYTAFGGGAAFISRITDMLSRAKTKLFYDTAICTVMIGG